MLKKLDAEIKSILLENNLYKYKYADELLEDAFDRITFEKFKDLLENKEFVEKVNNTEKEVIDDAMNSLWEDTIEKYDASQVEAKKQAINFYNYLKEISLKKENQE